MQYTRNTNDQFLREKLPLGWPWRLFIFTLTLLLISLLIYFGLIFGYKPILTKDIAKLNGELDNLSLQLPPEEQKNIVSFYSQITNLKSILNSHIIISKVFPFLEAITHQQVVYNSLSVSVPERILKIEGVAQSYDALVAQLFLYERASEVEKVTLEGSSLVDKMIRFSVKLILKNETFHL